jgi:hypothetical protein
MSENIFCAESSDSERYLFSSQFDQSGHPVQTRGLLTPLIPVSFVPLDQQLNILFQAGYQGFAFDILPGQYVFIPQNGNQGNLSAMANDGQQDSEEWNQAFSRISEMTDHYLGRNGIMHYRRMQPILDMDNSTPITISYYNSEHLNQDIGISNNHMVTTHQENVDLNNNSLSSEDHQSSETSELYMNSRADIFPDQNRFDLFAGRDFLHDVDEHQNNFPDNIHNDMNSQSNSTASRNSQIFHREHPQDYHSLQNMFEELLDMYFNGANRWIHDIVFNHPRQRRTRSLLDVVSSIVSENFETVLQTIIDAFITGVIVSQNFTLRQIAETLHTIENTRIISYDLASLLHGHSRIFNIFLSPTRLLQRYAQVVSSTTRWMIVNRTTSIPDNLPW